MNNVRAFFAIVPPKSMHALLSDIIESIRHSIPKHLIRWTQVEKIHSTLQFINSIKAEHIAPLIEKARMELKNTPSFQLEFQGLEWFPSPEHPKILSLAVGPHDILMPLSTTLANAISSLNYPIESRPFRGHMTLGRLPYYRMHHELLSKIKVPVIPPVRINKLYLIESKPEKGRTNYLPLAQFRLRLDK